jgi:hypothetical protein
MIPTGYAKPCWNNGRASEHIPRLGPSIQGAILNPLSQKLFALVRWNRLGARLLEARREEEPLRFADTLTPSPH